VFHVKNLATSTETVTLACTRNLLIDNAAGSTYTLAPGNAISVQSSGTGWIVLARI
jgi:hypothetical protein